jgi:hypothetical protein
MTKHKLRRTRNAHSREATARRAHLGRLLIGNRYVRFRSGYCAMMLNGDLGRARAERKTTPAPFT